MVAALRCTALRGGPAREARKRSSSWSSAARWHSWQMLAQGRTGQVQQQHGALKRAERRFSLRHECGHEKEPVPTPAAQGWWMRDQCWRARGGEEEADGSEWLAARLPLPVPSACALWLWGAGMHCRSPHGSARWCVCVCGRADVETWEAHY